MSGIKKDVCGMCCKHVSLGTLYKVNRKHICTWCYNNYLKGKKFNPKTKTWKGETSPAQELRNFHSRKKSQLLNVTLQARHFYKVKQDGVGVRLLPTRQVKAIEDFFLTD